MDNEGVNTELEIIPKDSVQLGMLRADSPTSVVDIATRIANKLTDVMNQKHLYADIKGKKFPTCEAWTTCAAMLGISPKEKSVSLNQQGDYEAVVELIDAQGQVVGGASASCGLDEEQWKDRLRFARRSMSITRATSKACRLKFSWIMTLAGFEPTPAEEMQFENHQPARAPQTFKEVKRVAKAAEEHRSVQGGEAWRQTVCTWGKNDGPVRNKRLGELKPNQVSFLYEKFVDEDSEHYIQHQDKKDIPLREGLVAWKVWTLEQKQKREAFEKQKAVEASWDTPADAVDEIPMDFPKHSESEVRPEDWDR